MSVNTRSTKTLTYKKNMSKDELGRVIKAIGLPLITLALAMFTISNFASYGTKLLCPLSGVMWVWGLFVAIIMPSMRKEVLNKTLITLIGYFLAMLGLKAALGVTSGVSAEMISASFSQSIPTATGNTIPGYISNVMGFVAIGVPIAHFTMEGKRLLQFKRNASLQKAFGQARDIRRTKNHNTRAR